MKTADLNETRGQAGMPVTSANFRDDVKADGTIDTADAQAVKKARGHSLP